MNGFEKIQGAPEVRVSEYAHWQLREPAHVAKVVESLVREYDGTFESNALVDTFEKHGMSPLDNQKRDFLAFRAGALVTLQIIGLKGTADVSERPPQTEGDGDIWSAAKDNFAGRLNSEFCLPSIVANNHFRNSSRQALERHQEFRPILGRLEAAYCNNARPTPMSYPALGMGFVLHCWDLNWNETVDGIVRRARQGLEADLARLNNM